MRAPHSTTVLILNKALRDCILWNSFSGWFFPQMITLDIRQCSTRKLHHRPPGQMNVGKVDCTEALLGRRYEAVHVGSMKTIDKA